MGRAGSRREREAPERRCIATGETMPAADLIRFVLSPDGVVTPDLAGKLPGRGIWLSPQRALVEKAVKKRLFAKAFRQAVSVPEGLADLLEQLTARRLTDAISLARKAGQAVTGAEKVRAHITSGQAGVLLQASDGAADGKGKLQRLAAAQMKSITCWDMLTSQELGLAFGRDFAIHAALDAGGTARRVCAEAVRLRGLRETPALGRNTREEKTQGGIANGSTTPANSDREPADGGGSDKDDR